MYIQERCVNKMEKTEKEKDMYLTFVVKELCKAFNVTPEELAKN